MDKTDVIFHAVMVVSLVLLTWSVNELYEDLSKKREINGLYISYAPDIIAARADANIWDSRGDFVCINVAYDMTPKEAYKTCIHECTHKSFSEIFAEECEAHPSKCYEGIWE